MQLSLRSSLLLVVMLGSVVRVASQTSASAQASTAGGWNRYCQPEGGFCFKYPSSWSVLGEVFDGRGVAVAPRQKQERTLWDAITVALVVPPPEGDKEPLGLNGVIEQATSGLRDEGQNFETLQRQQRTVDHQPAQLLKARYREKSTGHEWVEEVLFIEGPDNEVYSVALKCSPQELARLEPVFAAVVASWMLPEPEPPPDDDIQPATKQSTRPPAPPH
jgi:hypothetical protein